jgi:hypothetical protein
LVYDKGIEPRKGPGRRHHRRFEWHWARYGAIYPPDAVAEAILHAAAHPTRDLFIRAQVKLGVVAAAIAPRMMDRFMERHMYWSQRADRPSRPTGDSALHQAGYGLHERGTHQGWVRGRSYYLKAEKHPVLTTVLAAATVGIGLGRLGRARR